MTFRSNEEIEGLSLGKHVRLNEPVRTDEGEFTAGSILRIVGNKEPDGSVRCMDLDSGKTLVLQKRTMFSPCENPQCNIDRQVQ